MGGIYVWPRRQYAVPEAVKRGIMERGHFAGAGKTAQICRRYSTSTFKTSDEKHSPLPCSLGCSNGHCSKSHELKISPIDPVFKMAHLSYEHQVSPRWSLELAATLASRVARRGIPARRLAGFLEMETVSEHHSFSRVQWLGACRGPKC